MIWRRSPEIGIYHAGEETDSAVPSSGSRAKTRVHWGLRPRVGVGDTPIWVSPTRGFWT